MSVVRTDPMTGHLILLSRGRAGRTAAFLSEPVLSKNECPFCPGHEDQTPPEISRIERDGSWLLRVVPNRYPMIEAESASDVALTDSIFRKVGLSGQHEVLIESPDHEAEFDQLDDEAAASIVDCYMSRYGAHASNPAVRYIAIFKNDGRFAGASIPHLHSQLVAFNQIPIRALQEVATFLGGANVCSFCHTKNNPHLISATEHFVVLTAEIARTPYQVRIAPRSHVRTFMNLSDGEIRELGTLMQETLRALFRVLGRVSFNWTFQNAYPAHSNPEAPFHWYCEISPRVTIEAGFELATGIITNIVDPLDAAVALRKAF